jgi:hypothetical protein
MDKNRLMFIDQVKKILGHSVSRDGLIRIPLGPFRTK